MLRTLVWRPKPGKAKVAAAVSGVVTALGLEDERVHALDDPTRISDCLADGRACVWLDLIDPTPQELSMIQEEFGLHPLAIEDAARQAQRPKIELYDGTYFMVAFAIDPNPDAMMIGDVLEVRHQDQEEEPLPHSLGWMHGSPYLLHEIDLFIGRNFLITSHAVPLPVIDRAWTRWHQQMVNNEEGTGSVTYRVLDTIVDDYFPVLDGIVEQVEELEQRLFTMVHKGAKNDDLRTLFRIKRDLLRLRRVLGPGRDTILTLLRGDIPLFDRKHAYYFQDVYDHIARLTDSLDVYQDMLTNALESYLSLVSNNMNEVMRRLTALTIMLMVPTLIAGVYGMNFAHMPELEWQYGYPLSIVLMGGSSGGVFWYFRRLQWI